MTTHDRVTSGMNDSGTGSKSDTPLTHARSGFDLENARRNLIAKRNAAGADSPIGHRCSNLVELLDNYASAVACENKPARESLEVLIRKQMAELAQLTK